MERVGPSRGRDMISQGGDRIRQEPREGSSARLRVRRRSDARTRKAPPPGRGPYVGYTARVFGCVERFALGCVLVQMVVVVVGGRLDSE